MIISTTHGYKLKSTLKVSTYRAQKLTWSRFPQCSLRNPTPPKVDILEEGYQNVGVETQLCFVFSQPGFYLPTEREAQHLLLTFGLDGCFQGCSITVSIKVGVSLHCGIGTWRERMLQGKEQKNLQS